MSISADARRIRFAPLPDPRRAVLITDDGQELPLPSDDDDPDSLFLNDKHDIKDLRLSLPACIPASVSLSAISPSVSPCSSLPPPTPPSHSLPLPAIKEGVLSPAKQNTWPKALLKPFSANAHRKRSPSPSHPPSPYSSSEPSSACSGFGSGTSSSASSMHSLTPTQSIDPPGSSTPTQICSGSAKIRDSRPIRARFLRSNFSTEEILTLGTINLFRSSANKDADSGGWGSALTRWTSGGSANSVDGAPLSRTQSTQSYKGGNVRVSQRRSSSPAAKSKPNPAHANGLIGTLHSGTPKKGTRMLNGRVYGARRGSAANANPFANAKDDPDPEFVEWGYGGMGSVKSDGVGGRVWGRLMSDGTGLYDSKLNDEREKRRDEAGRGGDDMDDGSGMGWVRRRREQREREKKEREERERLEKEKEAEADNASKVKQDHAPTTEKPVAKSPPPSLPLPPAPTPDAEGMHMLLLTSDSAGAGVGSPTPTAGSSMATPTGHTPIHTPMMRSLSGGSVTSSSSSGHIHSPSSILVSSGSTPGTPGNDVLAAAAAGASSPPLPAAVAPAHLGSPYEDEHVMRAVNVPAPVFRHHSSSHHGHHHSRSRSLVEDVGEKPAAPSVEQLTDMHANANGEVSSVVADVAAEEEDALLSHEARLRHGSVSSSSTSASEDEDESSDERDEDEEEDDEEEEEENGQKRKTSLGAGVEKISRHK